MSDAASADGTAMSDDPTDELLRVLRECAAETPIGTLFACVDILLAEIARRP